MRKDKIMKQKRVLIWSKSISDLMDGDAYGIAVQLYFWAQTFTHHGWQVTTFTPHKAFFKEGIRFKHASRWGKLEIVHEWLSILWNLLTFRPRIVLHRGADRVVYPLAVLSKICNARFVQFGASDTDFEPGKELIAGGAHNRELWQKALGKVENIVTQNAYQHDSLKLHYGKESLILFNIWGKPDSSQVTGHGSQVTDVVWVANLRRLKRVEWILKAAKAMPHIQFTIIGGPSGSEKEYYHHFEKEAKSISNLHFLGKRTFQETNVIVANSRLLCCTSEFEGFPNTFLQAWAYDVPVVSTVNPNDCITELGLGKVISDVLQLQFAVDELLNSAEFYTQCQQNIRDYFTLHHDSDRAYQKVIEFISE